MLSAEYNFEGRSLTILDLIDDSKEYWCGICCCTSHSENAGMCSLMMRIAITSIRILRLSYSSWLGKYRWNGMSCTGILLSSGKCRKLTLFLAAKHNAHMCILFCLSVFWCLVVLRMPTLSQTREKPGSRNVI